MNQAAATEIVGKFLNAYPNTPADDGLVTLWTEALAGCDEADGKRAAAELIGASRFFPSIAEFRETVSNHRRRHALEFGGRQLGPGAIMGAPEGLQRAAEAYIAECRLQGRPPRQRILDGFTSGRLGAVRVPA